MSELIKQHKLRRNLERNWSGFSVGEGNQSNVSEEREWENGSNRHHGWRQPTKGCMKRTKCKEISDQQVILKKARNENSGSFNWGKQDKDAIDKYSCVEKEGPNFEISGKLTEDKNKLHGVVIKYTEPDEARKPKRRWRLYPFKGDSALPTLYIHRQSCYLIGRDRKVCDLPVDHPSCSKQHAAIQYRMVPFERMDRSLGKRVRPYIIDLESANGTFVNNKQIEARKYTELLERDVIKFGFSSREYVLLHENSQEDESDDDIPVCDAPIKKNRET